MATLSAALLQGIDKNVPRSKRKLQKHLRSAGLAYISRTGKLIPAKKVADELCQCPQKCDDRVPTEARERLFNHFYGMGDPDMQNAFLRDHMDVKARTNAANADASPTPPPTGNGVGTGRSPRRITCKYLVPLLPGKETADVCQKAFVSAFVITTKRVRLQREKLISSLGLNSYGHSKGGKAGSPNGTTNVRSTIVMGADSMEDSDNRTDEDGSSWGRHRLLSRRLVDDPLIPVGLLVPEGVTIAPVTATPDHDRDIAIVNNFFSNQLWKPEYIGTYS